MPRTIVLDGIERGPLRLAANPDGSLSLSASYLVKAGVEVEDSTLASGEGGRSRCDGAPYALPAYGPSAGSGQALQQAWDSIYTTIAAAELS